MTKLKGKIALITGGSRGLGRDAALRLAQEGANIIFTYNKNETKAFETVKELEDYGILAQAIQVDLHGTSSINSFSNKLTEILKKMGSRNIDFLINNAAISSKLPFTEMTEEEMDLIYNTNFKPLVFLTQKLEPLLNDNGRIITMGTGLTRVCFSPYIAYASMKAALETFTRYLALDLGKRGITVNAIAPGGIDNDFNAKRFIEMPEMKDYLISQTALGRLGRNEDIGGVTAFLCSEDASWITGQRIEVSGGFKL